MPSTLSYANLMVGLASVLVTAFTIIFPLMWRGVQKKRIAQEELFHRESHNLNLFKVLADQNHRLQLAAASILIERLKAPVQSTDDQAERRSILRALISVTKDSPTDSNDAGVSPELSKFVADNIVQQLGALHTTPSHGASPLKEFDWQNAHLDRAWWPSVDAREVDFWNASLREVGMAGADLRGAILKQANLENSVLRDANLQNADLREANLIGTDLTGAVIECTCLESAKYDSKTTKFPDGFDAIAAGMLDIAAKPGTFV